MHLYEILLLGAVPPETRDALTATLRDLLADYGLNVDDVVVRTAVDAQQRSDRAACVAAYFGGAPDTNEELVATLLRKGVPVLPTVAPGEDFTALIPKSLQAVNGLRRKAEDMAQVSLATALLECLGLLHRQRRAFVSYRRTEAEGAAVQLFNELASRGYSVFLDTHSIRPGKAFQDELWHQMCDCDVVVMLDTATYFDSRWTREEIAKARAKELQVLRVVWPGLTPSRLTDMSETVYLSRDDLVGEHGPVRAERLDAIALQVEWLRSRSVASRHRSMSDRLRADLERIGGKFHGVGAHRAMSLELLGKKRLWAYPVVGVPTAETLHDIYLKARSQTVAGEPVLVYDDIGLHDGWNAHLDWLGEQIQAIRWIKINRAAWTLAGMEE